MSPHCRLKQLLLKENIFYVVLLNISPHISFSWNKVLYITIDYVMPASNVSGTTLLIFSVSTQYSTGFDEYNDSFLLFICLTANNISPVNGWDMLSVRSRFSTYSFIHENFLLADKNVVDCFLFTQYTVKNKIQVI